MSTSRKGISSPLNILELPRQITGLSGKFKYISFEPEERTTVANVFDKFEWFPASDGGDKEPESVPPRWIEITVDHKVETNEAWPYTYVTHPDLDLTLQELKIDYNYDETHGGNVKSRTKRQATDHLRELFFSDPTRQMIHSTEPAAEAVYFTQDFCQGYVRNVGADLENTVSLKKVTSSELHEKTTLEYIKQSLSGSLYGEDDMDQYESFLSDPSSTTGIIELDENTLQPTTENIINSDSLPSDSYINSSYIHRVFNRTKQSPLVWNITDRTVQLAELIEDRAAKNKERRYLSSFKYQVASGSGQGEGLFLNCCYFSDTIVNFRASNSEIYVNDDGWYHMGYQVLKYVDEGGNRNFRGSFIVPKTGGSGSTTIKDPYVMYGKEYFYEIRDCWLYVKPVFKSAYIEPSESIQEVLMDSLGYSWSDAIQVHTQAAQGTGVSLLEEELRKTQDGTDIIDNNPNWQMYFSMNPQPIYSLGYTILGTQSMSISVKCAERMPPLPPTSFTFNYIGDNEIKINWSKQVKILENEPAFGNSDRLMNIPCDDIGGFLIFIRNNLLDSYELYRQFHMITKQRPDKLEDASPTGFKAAPQEPYTDTGIPRDIIAVNVGENNVDYVKDGVNFSHVLSLRSNVDYYVAMASYDVHGNISTYSEQFFIRRNNVTGEVSTRIICGAGAPLSYPNMIIPSKFVLSSMKASGYKHMNIYQTPTTPQSFPKDGSITIQLIDLETEADTVIEGVGPARWEEIKNTQ